MIKKNRGIWKSESGAYTSWKAGWKLPAAGRGGISFKAIAGNDIHVAISPENKTSDSMYEIVVLDDIPIPAAEGKGGEEGQATACHSRVDAPAQKT